MTGIRKTALRALERAEREEGLTEIPLKETVQAAGIQRLKSDDCRIVINGFISRHPEYRAVKLCTEEQMRNDACASLWETCALTMNQYDSEESFWKEIRGEV